MYLVRVPLFIAVLLSVVTACRRDVTTVTTPAPAVARETNAQVLDQDGRCKRLVEVDYNWYQSTAPRFEEPLVKAMSDLDQARVAGTDERTQIELAHAVRKAYAKLVTQWYKPFLDFTGGPFRCRLSGATTEELSSDDLYGNVPRYTAYVESIQDIPEGPRPGKFKRLWQSITGTR